MDSSGLVESSVSLKIRAVEITEENLEDLLAYDDLFLDYFNAFLALPVFSQPLYYNRLTGTFLEVQGTDAPIGESLINPATPPYGATDEERDRMLEWAKEERLPLFLKTQLFREFKLCKLLLRALEESLSAGRGSSRQIRGYSRQTESYASSLSNSADNSANEVDFDEDEADPWAHFRHQGLYRYPRPGSRALSLPTRLGLAREFSYSAGDIGRRAAAGSRDNQQQFDESVPVSADSPRKQPTATSQTVPSALKAGDSVLDMTLGKHTAGGGSEWTTSVPVSREVTFEKQDTLHAINENGDTENVPQSQLSQRSARRSANRSARTRSGRRRSAKSNKENEETDDEPIKDFDEAFGEEEPSSAPGEMYVTFGDDVVSDQQTINDVKTLEGKHKMSIQQMKEHVLGTVAGMDQFKDFLHGTSGESILNFWLDCEYFKDTMEEYDEDEYFAIRNKLFRDIKDKYRMSLTADARAQLAQAGGSTSVSHTVFIRAQYDVLRRMRAYWVPRFLIHKERMDELRLELAHDPMTYGLDMLLQRDGTSATCFFPSISLVNSMPVRPDDVLAIATGNKTNWESVSKGGRKLDDRVKSAKRHRTSRPLQKTLREKMTLAMMADKYAGGPFKQFLERHQDGKLLANMLLWEDVTEYGAAEDRSADRMLRMVNAWNIFNTYVAKDSLYNIGLSDVERDELHKTLLKSKDFIEATVFNEAKEKAIGELERAWVRYLKEDMKSYYDCHMRTMETPPSTAEEYELILDEYGDSVIVSRPRPWVRRRFRSSRYPPSTGSERGRRLRTALSVAESIDEERLAERRRIARERKRETERERRKSLRMARERARQAKLASKKLARNRHNQQEQDESGEQQPEDPNSVAPSRAQTDKQSTKPAETPAKDPTPQPEKPPTFYESLSNKGVINMFKKHISENEGKDVTHLVSLFMEIETYNHIHDGGKKEKQKKDSQAGVIYKSYMEQGAKKKVHLSDKLSNKIRADKERPKSATLKDVQSFILPHIEEHFKTYWKTQASELGLDSNSLANMSKAELAMRADDPSLLNAWRKSKQKSGGRDSDDGGSLPRSARTTDSGTLNVSESLLKLALSDEDFKYSKKPNTLPTIPDANEPSSFTSSPVAKPRAKGHQHDDGTETKRKKKKPDGRAQPTKDDKVEFLIRLSEASAGRLPVQMLYFYRYLVKHGADDGMPYIDKDLFFYCEVQKFKDCSHTYSDEEMMKRKVQSILEVFLESSNPPALQVDIPSDVHQKAIRAAQRYVTGKEILSTIFDEAQYSVFKELLPYWAGFMRNYKSPEDPNKKPLTKQERERQKRLEEIKQWKPPSAKSFRLPVIPKGSNVQAFSFSLNDGIKWRDPNDYDPTENDSTADGHDDEEQQERKVGRRASTRLSTRTTLGVGKAGSVIAAK